LERGGRVIKKERNTLIPLSAWKLIPNRKGTGDEGEKHFMITSNLLKNTVGTTRLHQGEKGEQKKNGKEAVGDASRRIIFERRATATGHCQWVD